MALARAKGQVEDAIAASVAAGFASEVSYGSTLLYKVEPEYSEKARKAKYQGTLGVYAEVNPSGRAVNPKNHAEPGLGVDEKAIEGIGKWRFRSGYKDGKPATVIAMMEVRFQLL
jgi:hypothetical protein